MLIISPLSTLALIDYIPPRSHLYPGEQRPVAHTLNSFLGFADEVPTLPFQNCEYSLLTNAEHRTISAAITMNTSHTIQSKEVIALDADDHLLRPMFIPLTVSEMRLFQVQVNRVPARDTFLPALDD